MAIQNQIEALKIGTVVKILNSGYGHAKIADYRGPLGPKCSHLPRSRPEEAAAHVH